MLSSIVIASDGSEASDRMMERVRSLRRPGSRLDRARSNTFSLILMGRQGCGFIQEVFMGSVPPQRGPLRAAASPVCAGPAMRGLPGRERRSGVQAAAAEHDPTGRERQKHRIFASPEGLRNPGFNFVSDLSENRHLFLRPCPERRTHRESPREDISGRLKKRSMFPWHGHKR
jgi:hypothetical protein